MKVWSMSIRVFNVLAIQPSARMISSSNTIMYEALDAAGS